MQLPLPSPRPLARRSTPGARLALALSLLGGCGGWPTAANLDDPADLPIGGTDARPVVDWALWRATEPPEQPPGADLGALRVGRGLALRQQLDGVGWWSEAVPETLADPDCGSEGVRTATDPGDWIGDVDVFDLTVDDDATLCVQLDTPDVAVGLDLVALPLDACGVPVGVLRDDDAGPLGADQRGPVVRWRARDAGGRVAIVLGGFVPNEVERTVPYDLFLSAVADDEAACPDPDEGRRLLEDPP